MNAMLKPIHEPEGRPCVWCWGKRFAMTTHRDECGRPTCADCAGRKDRAMQMPSFVLNDILELES